MAGLCCALGDALARTEWVASPGVLLAWAICSHTPWSTSPGLRTVAQHDAAGEVPPLPSLSPEAVVHKSNRNVPEVPVFPELLAPLSCVCGCAHIPEHVDFNLCCF